MLPFSTTTDIGRTKPPLLPPGPPSDEEPEQRQGDERTDSRETADHPATERVASATTGVAGGIA